jgi:thioredoxin reductase (NADPH)
MVLLICRSDKLKMDAVHKNKIEQQNNIVLLLKTEVTGYTGPDSVERIEVTSNVNKHREIEVDGIFMAIGWKPNTGMLDLKVQKTPEGYLKTDEKLMTSFPGLFVAGDVRDTDMWQVLTACADGARAAKYAAGFIETLENV